MTPDETPPTLVISTAIASDDQINEWHSEVERSGRTTVEYAIQIGRALVERKKSLPHGAWVTYVEEHFPFSYETAKLYRRAAERFDAQSGSALPFSGSLRGLLAGSRKPKPKPVTDGEAASSPETRGPEPGAPAAATATTELAAGAPDGTAVVACDTTSGDEGVASASDDSAARDDGAPDGVPSVDDAHNRVLAQLHALPDPVRVAEAVAFLAMNTPREALGKIGQFMSALADDAEEDIEKRCAMLTADAQRVALDNATDAPPQNAAAQSAEAPSLVADLSKDTSAVPTPTAEPDQPNKRLTDERTWRELHHPGLDKSVFIDMTPRPAPSILPSPVQASLPTAGGRNIDAGILRSFARGVRQMSTAQFRSALHCRTSDIEHALARLEAAGKVVRDGNAWAISEAMRA